MSVHSLPLPRISETIEDNRHAKITLFLGFKSEDRSVFTDTLHEALEYDLFDALYMVPSNKEKFRVQDCFEQCKEVLVRKLGEQGGWLYVCGARETVKGVRERMMDVIGSEVSGALGERYIEETF